MTPLRGALYLGGKHRYEQVLGSTEFHAALLRSLGFSILVLAIQLPLGIYIALNLPFEGLLSKFYIIIFAIPLLMPVIMVVTSGSF